MQKILSYYPYVFTIIGMYILIEEVNKCPGCCVSPPINLPVITIAFVMVLLSIIVLIKRIIMEDNDNDDKEKRK